MYPVLITFLFSISLVFRLPLPLKLLCFPTVLPQPWFLVYLHPVLLMVKRLDRTCAFSWSVLVSPLYHLSAWLDTTLQGWLSVFLSHISRIVLDLIALRFLFPDLSYNLFLWWWYSLYFSGFLVSVYLCHIQRFLFVALNIFLSIGLQRLFFLLGLISLLGMCFFLCFQ